MATTCRRRAVVAMGSSMQTGWRATLAMIAAPRADSVTADGPRRRPLGFASDGGMRLRVRPSSYGRRRVPMVTHQLGTRNGGLQDRSGGSAALGGGAQRVPGLAEGA
jgi:hypothetical protein